MGGALLSIGVESHPSESDPHLAGLFKNPHFHPNHSAQLRDSGLASLQLSWYEPGMDEFDPVFVELEDRLPNTGWTRRLTQQESLQRFRRVVAALVPTHEGPRPATEEEFHARAIFQGYRWLRWLLQGLGWAGPADPISFVTEVQAHRQGSPYASKPHGMWRSPIARQVVHLGSSTLPGIYDLQRELAFSGSNGLFLQPPDDSDGSRRTARDRNAFLGSLAAGIDALGLQTSTADHCELGLDVIDPRRFGADGTGWLSDEEYLLFCSSFPTAQELLDHEQQLLTALAEALAETNEDQLRMFLRRRWQMGEFEAFSIAQTAKAWSASLRPIDVEIERRLALRRLEGASDRARIAGDHRGEIMASSQIARILGLAQDGPADTDDAAAQAALAAHENTDPTPDPHGPDDPTALLDSPAPSLEEWREQQGLPKTKTMLD